MAIAVVVAAGLVVTAFFLPWGTASYPWADLKPTINGEPVDPVAMHDFLGGLSGKSFGSRLSLPIMPWTDHWPLWGMELPHWLILAAAAWTAGLSLLACVPRVRMPAWLPLLFCAYGLAHLAYVGTTVFPYGSPGAGFVLTSGAFVAMTVSAILDAGSRRRQWIRGA